MKKEEFVSKLQSLFNEKSKELLDIRDNALSIIDDFDKKINEIKNALCVIEFSFVIPDNNKIPHMFRKQSERNKYSSFSLTGSRISIGIIDDIKDESLKKIYSVMNIVIKDLANPHYSTEMCISDSINEYKQSVKDDFHYSLRKNDVFRLKEHKEIIDKINPEDILQKIYDKLSA